MAVTLSFRAVCFIVYTVFVWLSIVGTASSQDTLHRSENSVGPKTSRLTEQAHIAYPNATSVEVILSVHDIHGIAAAVMFTSGMLGLTYVALQNGIMLLPRTEKLWRWFAWLVRFVESATGHLILLVWAVVMFVGEIVCEILAMWIAKHRGPKVSIQVDGIFLTQDQIEALEIANKMPIRYNGHGYVRFMCIAPWVQIGTFIFPLILHIMAYRRLRAASSISREAPSGGAAGNENDQVAASTSDDLEKEGIDMVETVEARPRGRHSV